MHYLRWSKLHCRARYELTASGVPSIPADELCVQGFPLNLDVRGPYGDPALLDAVAALYAVRSDWIVPVPGTSTANFIALAIGAPRGTRILVEHPVYDPFQRAATFLGLDVVALPRKAEEAFCSQLEHIRAGLSNGVRAVVLTNLHNPSGGYLQPEAVTEVARCCRRAGAVLIVDEVYLDAASLTSGHARWTSASLAENVIATSSLTKVYGLGGLRVGWLIAHPEMAERAQHVMDMLSVENPAPATSVALHALSKLPLLEERYRRYYHEGRSAFVRWLTQEPLLAGYDSHGALFEWLRLPEGVSAGRFTDRLAGQYETQVVPGGFFGADDHIRLSISLPAPDLDEALGRISTAIRRFVKEMNT